MDGRQTILQMKYARIIEGISQKQNVSREEAMDRFYHSETFQMIQSGIADLHCRSDRYLVDEFCLEWNTKGQKESC
jgi:hypothetical protein